MITKKNENVPIYHSYLKGNSYIPNFQDPFLVKYMNEVFVPYSEDDVAGLQIKNYYREFQNFIKRQINGLGMSTIKWKRSTDSFEFWIAKKCYIFYGYFNTFAFDTLLSYDCLQPPHGIIIGPVSTPGAQTRMPLRVPLGTVGKEVNYLAHKMATVENKDWAKYDKEEKFFFDPPIEEKMLFQYYPITYAVSSIRQ